MKQPATKLKSIIASHKSQKKGLLEYLMLVSREVSKDTLLEAGIKDPLKILWSLRRDGWDIETMRLRSTKLLEGGTFFHLKPASDNC